MFVSLWFRCCNTGVELGVAAKVWYRLGRVVVMDMFLLSVQIPIVYVETPNLIGLFAYHVCHVKQPCAFQWSLILKPCVCVCL